MGVLHVIAIHIDISTSSLSMMRSNSDDHNSQTQTRLQLRSSNYHLKALNFIANQFFRFSPPRSKGSTQIGQRPSFPGPLPLTNRGV